MEHVGFRAKKVYMLQKTGTVSNSFFLFQEILTAKRKTVFEIGSQHFNQPVIMQASVLPD